MMDGYCQQCHADAHEKWSNSVHRFASFNNPAYLFSVRNTRAFAMERDGDVRAARFCAGCHDPAPFFSGAFDDPDFDDVNHPTAQAGITCTACHAITHLNSPRGNADYTIEEPLHYPFARSSNELLSWVNALLVKAKPAFHKKTFLKPLHQSAEFCGACHKVHLDEPLNGYRWLRGQNHYDTYQLSGVSGHGVSSFYYPDEAEHNCNGCHMPMHPSTDFGAQTVGGQLQIHDHQFASANTAIPHLMDLPEWVNDAHRSMLEGSLRVDIFGVREAGAINGELRAPLRPVVPVLEPGQTYLIEIVLRTLTLGHTFTQGTADSNQIWLDVTASRDGEVIAASGQVDEQGIVDETSHFVNAYVVDADGYRIDRRNPEDIHTTLYNNQIPPGAADVVHYALIVPPDHSGPLKIEAHLRYRKFDTHYLRLFMDDEQRVNDLPITTIATDAVVFGSQEDGFESGVSEWQRWNDYGIGLLRKGGRGQLRQAEEAFSRVEYLGRADGPINLTRVYLREGRLAEAAQALHRAQGMPIPGYPWTQDWLAAQVNEQNGYLDEAIAGYEQLVATPYALARERGFDFSQDYRLLIRLANVHYQRGQGYQAGSLERNNDLEAAIRWYGSALALDPENADAHYGLAQAYAAIGRTELNERHRDLHARYRVDDNARDRAIRLARERDPAANHAADPVVIYTLTSPGTRLDD